MNLTIGMACYSQPLMLAEWFRCYGLAEVANETDDVQVLVVDDCGTPAAEVPDHHNVRLLRICENKPWNQGEARNLAALQAKGRVLLMVDPDMTLPPGSLASFVEAAKNLPRKRVVRPVLRHGDGKIDKTSPNVYLIHREDFLASKGYDLAYCGRKGWSDVTLSQVWAKMFRSRIAKTLVLDFHHGGKFTDAQVVGLSRDVSKNKALHVKHVERLRKLGIAKFLAEHSPMVKSPWAEIR